MTPGDTPRANLLWATLIVEELARSGVDFFCVAPGSRSTPLIAALAANERARSLVHFDERGTAFAALGYARATGRPAAWITTSGTAVANGLPAVVEAAIDGVPMILLTADRPPELRQTGANQTIDQPDIFGDYVRWRFDLPAPEAAVDPAMVLTTVDQAVYRARRTPSGPVHLNLMFREPFLPEDGDEPLAAPVRWRESDEPYTRYAATRPAVDLDEVERLREELRPVKKGLVVAGRLLPESRVRPRCDSPSLLTGRSCRTWAPRYGSAHARRTSSPTTTRYWRANSSKRRTRPRRCSTSADVPSPGGSNSFSQGAVPTPTSSCARTPSGSIQATG